MSEYVNNVFVTVALCFKACIGYWLLLAIIGFNMATLNCTHVLWNSVYGYNMATGLLRVQQVDEAHFWHIPKLFTGIVPKPHITVTWK